MKNQIRQCIYIGFYKSKSNKMKIGETCQKVCNRAKDIAKDDFRPMWFAELQTPKKESGLEAEERMREYFQEKGIEQISTDHFLVPDARHYIEDNLLDLKVYLREHNVRIGYERFMY